jgi:hypothetical protein
MANLDQLPTATPDSARKASRSRKAALNQSTANVTGTENTETTGSTDASTETGSVELMPPPRVESENTTETAPITEVSNEPTPLMVLCAKNPKRAGSKAANFFAHYYSQGETPNLSTVEDAFGRGVRGKDLSWDRARGHVIVGDQVTAYQALTTDEERIAWIKAEFKDFGDYAVKLAGFVVAVPEPVAEKIEEQKEAEQADLAPGQTVDGKEPVTA